MDIAFEVTFKARMVKSTGESFDPVLQCYSIYSNNLVNTHFTYTLNSNRNSGNNIN